MIDIFMVKLGFLGSSIPPLGRFLGSGFACTCSAQCCPWVLSDIPGAGLHPKFSPVHPQMGAGTH